MLHGDLKHESWCNRSASQRASNQYVTGHGHVAYASFIDEIPCFYNVPPQIGNLPINGACATQSCAMIYRLEVPGDGNLCSAPCFISPLDIERALEDNIV